MYNGAVKVPQNLPAKPTEDMKEAREAESLYEPFSPIGVPNCRSKAGIFWTPAKLVVSNPKSMLSKAVTKQLRKRVAVTIVPRLRKRRGGEVVSFAMLKEGKALV